MHTGAAFRLMGAPLSPYHPSTRYIASCGTDSQMAICVAANGLLADAGRQRYSFSNGHLLSAAGRQAYSAGTLRTTL